MTVDISEVPKDFFVPPEGVSAVTDEYFNKTALIATRLGGSRVTYAVFLRTPIVVAVELACEFIRRNYDGGEGAPLEIKRIFAEGTLVQSGKKILEITGDWSQLSAMETGFLQRVGFSCVSARAAYEMCCALKDVPFLAMDPRHTTGRDMMIACAYGAAVGGNSAKIQGAKGFIGSSAALVAPFWGLEKGLGTMPHALVGWFKAHKPDLNATLEATKAYAEAFPDERTITSLVDYNGMEVTDGIAVAEWFFNGAKLNEQDKKLALRLDTHGGRYLEGLDWDRSVAVLKEWTHLNSPEEIIDRAIDGIPVRSFDARDPIDLARKNLFDTGVTAAAIVQMRRALDAAGFRNVLLVGSSGFNVLKCQMMANLGVPLNVVGTGSFLPSKVSTTYATADIIAYDGIPSVKIGREYLITG